MSGGPWGPQGAPGGPRGPPWAPWAHRRPTCALWVASPQDFTLVCSRRKLTLLLNKHCNALIQALIQFDVVEAFGRCICEHQESHTRTDILVQSFLGIVHNALLYCTENQKRLRMHLATHSTVVQDIMAE